MIANIIIIVFVLAMAYWWALQGFFSAFLHLMLVLVAGSLAFAVWEPLVFAFGMKMQPLYAWGLWLLGPFVLLLLGLRLAFDRLIKMNVQFPNLIGMILGGATGAVSGVVTAGIALIGLSFLPLPASLAGYQPFLVSGGGGVTPGNSLWVPVDRIAANTFASLSLGGFYTDTPLAIYQPDLARQAGLFRMRYDENASVVAVPGSVRVAKTYVQPAPVRELDAAVALAMGPAAQDPNRKLVLVDTNWSQAPGTYDADAALRLPPTQIRLITQGTGISGRGNLAFHAPIAFSQVRDGGRVFQPFNAADVTAFGVFPNETIGWVFSIPADETPRFLHARHTRIELGEPDTDVAGFVAAMGKPAPKQDATADAEGASQAPSELGGREGVRSGHVATDLELTNRLPKEISKNFATGLQTNETAVMEGTATVSQPPGSLSRNTRIDSIFIPGHQGAIRLRLAQDRAQSLLGQARLAAADLNGVWLTDARGEKYLPIGYVWHKNGGEMEVSVNRLTPITSARQLPVSQMSGGDNLYLYFGVPKGAQIVSYNIGDAMEQPIEPPLDLR